MASIKNECVCFSSGSVPGVPPSPALRCPRPRRLAARPRWVLHLSLHQPPEGSVPPHRGLLLHLGPQTNMDWVHISLRRWRHAPQQAPDLRLLGHGPALQLHRWPDGLSGLLCLVWFRPHTSIFLHCLHDYLAGPPLCSRWTPLQQQVWQRLETVHRCRAFPAHSWSVLERGRVGGIMGGRKGERGKDK